MNIAQTNFASRVNGRVRSFKKGESIPADVPEGALADWLKAGLVVDDTPPVVIAESLLAAEDLPAEVQEAAEAEPVTPKKKK
ncbi:MAG: hypothetical protein OT477_14860 [Chloroflexi bacterium]|nr:hypothetical protein [Chloroflexota bacterium]